MGAPLTAKEWGYTGRSAAQDAAWNRYISQWESTPNGWRYLGRPRGKRSGYSGNSYFRMLLGPPRGQSAPAPNTVQAGRFQMPARRSPTSSSSSKNPSSRMSGPETDLNFTTRSRTTPGKGKTNRGQIQVPKGTNDALRLMGDLLLMDILNRQGSLGGGQGPSLSQRVGGGGMAGHLSTGTTPPATTPSLSLPSIDLDGTHGELFLRGARRKTNPLLDILVNDSSRFDAINERVGGGLINQLFKADDEERKLSNLYKQTAGTP